MPKISDFVELKKPRLSARYSRAKVPIGYFIEDYMRGDIDVVGDFKRLMKHKNDVFEYVFIDEHYKFFFTRFIPEVLIHSKEQDERIVRSHYDNRNDFFSWFLGPRMVYTSAFFHATDESLEVAQDRKMDLVAQKIQLKAGEKLLDIGCGWGTLVMYLAKHYGVDATGITIAQAGVDWGMNQIRENGMEDRARIMRMDYRDIPEKKYHKITCLEMAEHVGIKNFKKFMAQVYNLLDDDGLFYLQIAGLRARPGIFAPIMNEDTVWGLFMNKYIFSGADASMPLSFVVKNLERVGFEIHSVENIGIHYSRTIDLWYENWMHNESKIVEKYGIYWFRMYQIFLGWSVEIAKQGSSTCFQIVCNKNRDTLNRYRWIGAVNIGERDSVKMHSSDTIKV